MTLKVKITIAYLLVNFASLFVVLGVIHDYVRAIGTQGPSIVDVVIAVGLANILIAVILAAVFLERFTRGLDSIVRAVGLISMGDFSQRVPERNGRDELALLATSFNGMAETLDRNIRELRQSEEKYSTLVENASDGIVIIEDRKYVFANRTFLRIMGYSEKELIGMDYLDIVAPESAECLRERHTKRLQGLDVPTITEARFIDRNGEARYFEINAGLIERNDRKAVLVIFRDITDSKEYQMSLKKLSEQVLKTQEEERKRISRELHDEIGQALSAMNINIEILLANGTLQDSSGEKRLRDMKKLTEKSIDDIHRISYNLRPYLLDKFGLVAAVRWYTETFAERTGVEVGLHIEGEWEKLHPTVETTVYRVIQEALTNISKHAEAKRAFVSLSSVSDGMEIFVEDDGKGFETEREKKRGNLIKGGLGLFGIGERVASFGGSFSITSNLGAGTKLAIRIPASRIHAEENSEYEQDQGSSC
jgi:PAS domain S-box-containing protein